MGGHESILDFFVIRDDLNKEKPYPPFSPDRQFFEFAHRTMAIEVLIVIGIAFGWGCTSHLCLGHRVGTIHLLLLRHQGEVPGTKVFGIIGSR